MHPSLRPELRGAQRVLRSLRTSQSVDTHRTVRSFTSFIRLQDQSSPGGSQNNPSNNPKANQGGLSAIRRLIEEHRRDLPDNVWGAHRPEDFLSHVQNLPGADEPAFAEGQTDHTSTKDVIQQETKAIQDFLNRGEIPPGYQIARSEEDVANHIPWMPQRDGQRPMDLPLLFARDMDKSPSLIPIPKDFPALNQHDTSTTAANTGEDTKAATDVDQLQSTKYHGSRQNRRKRARDNKAAAAMNEHLPSWFTNNNITIWQPDTTSAPDVVAVRHLPDGTYTPVSVSLEQVQAQIPKEEVQETGTEPLEHAYGTGGDGDTSTAASPTPPRAVSDQSQDSRNHVSLPGDRYFIESAQYQELLNTFRGRLSQPADPAQKKGRAPVSMNHLTMLHGAKDADLLLDTLVLDLCKSVGANRVRLDVQDIAELIASADLDPEIARKGAKLSFKIYRDIFGSGSVYQESLFPREEDEEDEDGDDEDGPGPRGSIDIPVGIAFGSGGMPKNMFGDIRRSLSKAGPALSQLLGSPMDSESRSIPGHGLFGHLVESILSASTDAQKGNPAPAGQSEAETQETALTTKPRPIVVHLPNYRALQSHHLAEAFMGELLHAADMRREQNQPVIIIGTDCMRDFSTSNNPRAILEEQENRSYGASTSIVLTPVFPTRDAELALIRDRENKIRNINVRHLHLILKTRGVLLKGLEEGFWHRDYSAELGEADFKALSDSYWPFIYVQRVAAMIAGNDLSQTPIADAVETIAQSDESKVAWARRTQPDIIKEDIKEAEKPDNKRLRQIRSKATRHEKKLLSGVIEPKKIATTFQDIHIPAETVEALQTLTTLSLVRPEAFKYGVLKSDRIPGLLLYGPPGTGKTLAAKAVAKESGATMLEVSAADLNDMYVGEGEKNVQALFSLAKKLSPCVVFLDEADAMFSARSAQGRRVSHRELLNQFLKEWDGMSNDSGSAFIMVATNRPMDLDDAVLRRLPRRLLVDLPTEADRLEILKIHLRQEALAEAVNLPELAKKTPFYSGSDLKNVAVAAALAAVREENEAAKKFRKDNPESEKPYEYPEKRVLTQSHFDKALEEISASISEDMSSLREIKKFDEQYGDRKGRKRKSPRWGFKSPAEADKVLDTVKVRS